MTTDLSPRDELPRRDERPRPHRRTTGERPLLRRRHGRIAFAVLFLAVATLFVVTLGPVLQPLLLGCLLAAFCSPLRGRVEARSGRRGLAAAVVTVLVGLAVLVPVAILATLLVDRAAAVVARAPELMTWLQSDTGLRRVLGDSPMLRWMVPSGLDARVQEAARWLANALPGVLGGVLDAGLAMFITLLTTYYLLRDGPWMLTRIERALPLEPRYTRALVREFQAVGRSVIVGTLGTAAVQGIVAGLCYWALGVPEPLLLGALTGVCSVVPVLGSGLVWLPLAAVLALTGHMGRAAILLLVGVVVIGAVDNVVRPLLSRGGLDVHPLLVFVGLFGGLAAFGASGLYLGPLFVALFVTVARIYERDLSPWAAAVAPPTPPPGPPAL